MLKKFLILVSFILFTYSLFASVRGVGEMIVKWDYNLNFSDSSDMAQGIAVDSENNIIIVGHDREDLTRDEWRIMKFDKDKNLLWNKTFDPNPTGNDRAYGVAVDSENNIIIVGYDRETGSYRWLIIKLNSTGDQIWNYTSTYTGEARDVAIDSSDNITVVGYDNEPGNYQWRIVKLDTNKNLLWDKPYNLSSSTDMAYAVAIDPDDNITVVGSYWNSTSDDDWWIMKLNLTGDQIWNYTKDLSTGSDVARGVAVDSDDNIIVIGYDIEYGNFKWRIIKLNSTGDQIWNYTVNYGSNDMAFDVAIDSDDNIIAIGSYLNSTSGNDWLIIKLNSIGDSIWNYTNNISSNTDRAYGVANYSNNNIIVVGYDSLPSSTDSEWRIMEFTLCGNGDIDPTSGEDCDYNAANPDGPCLSYQYCNNVCRCSDLFDVWIEPNQMLFTIAQKTPINLYIKNTGPNTDNYSIEAEPSNPAIIDVDISGSSPTKPVDPGTTELIRPWVTVLAATLTGEREITFNITSPGHPGKYRTAYLGISEGLPISLFEFNILGLITIMILAGVIYYTLKLQKQEH